MNNYCIGGMFPGFKGFKLLPCCSCMSFLVTPPLSLCKKQRYIQIISTGLKAMLGAQHCLKLQTYFPVNYHAYTNQTPRTHNSFFSSLIGERPDNLHLCACFSFARCTIFFTSLAYLVFLIFLTFLCDYLDFLDNAGR